jgi:leucyl aminopeptidase (aminopeptidase T)
MEDLELIEAAHRIVTQVVSLRRDQEVLILTDPLKVNIAHCLALACRETGARTVISIMPVLKEHGMEPPGSIAAAMAASDVVLAPTTHAITHTAARRSASRQGVRVFILRGVDEEMMRSGAMSVDFHKLRDITEQVARTLEGAQEIHVTSPSGTDIRFSIGGRRVFRLDGFYKEDMGFGALPGGECPISPLEGTAHGTLVVDHSMDGIGLLSEPLVLTVEEGRVSSLRGGASESEYLQGLFSQDPLCRNLAEFSIGTNPAARLTANLAEVKKRLGTVHFALGDNVSLGGEVEASVHLDVMVLRPTVMVDGRLIVQEGRLMLQGVGGP